MTPGESRVLLVDGHSLAYRAFHAVPESMKFASGRPAGAVHGFISSVSSVARARRADMLAICFDAGRDPDRTALFPAYKASRKPAPEGIREQVATCADIFLSCGVPVVRLALFEADDALAALAHRSVALGAEQVDILTGDRDLLQLVSDRVTVVHPASKGSLQVMTPETVEAAYGVAPARYALMAALRGDVSDNVPGVPGVGAKTAARIASRFADPQAVLSAAEAGVLGLSERIQSEVASFGQQLDVNFRLMRLDPARCLSQVASVVPAKLRDPDFLGDRVRVSHDLEANGLRQAAARLAGLFDLP